MNILALEPWYGGSHRRFLDGLVAHSAHAVRPLSLAARSWKWRMQGGAVPLAQKAREAVAEGFRPDLVFASSMVNVPAFLALTRQALGPVPVVLYMHENQLTYPLREGDERDYTYGFINILSMLAADAVVFNSAFHRDEFFEALPLLLRRFPDYNLMGAVGALKEKTTVLHLGLDLDALDAHRPGPEAMPDPGPPIILWNQRWEHDKNPEAFFRTMNRLDDAGARFRLILAGKGFAVQPPAFERAMSRYAERVVHYGYAEDFAEYARLLWRADLVVSTALHEFFGIAMQESIHCGCHPLLPNRLSYPELIPESLQRPLLHAPILYEDEDALFENLRRLLSGADQPLPPDVLRPIPARLAWPVHGPHFDALFERVAASA